MAQLHAHFGSSDAIVQAALGAFTEDGLESSTGVSQATTVSASPAIQYVSRSGSSYDRVMMEMGSRHASAGVSPYDMPACSSIQPSTRANSSSCDAFGNPVQPSTPNATPITGTPTVHTAGTSLSPQLRRVQPLGLH